MPGKITNCIERRGHDIALTRKKLFGTETVFIKFHWCRKRIFFITFDRAFNSNFKEILLTGNSSNLAMKNIEKEMSRREFLKGAGAISFLTLIGFPRRAFAKLEELLKNREFIDLGFEEGIERLKSGLWDSKEEKLWVYIEKGDRKGWLDVAASSTEDEVSGIDLTPLFGDQDVSKLYHVHTHLPTRDQKSGHNRHLLHPPSATDIMALAVEKEKLRKTPTPKDTKYYVLESKGIWTYDVDIDHPTIQKAIQYLKMRNFSPAENLDQYMQDWKRKIQYSVASKEKRQKEVIREFQMWLKEKYGVTISYTPHEIITENEYGRSK